jgi:hypothetical protein
LILPGRYLLLLFFLLSFILLFNFTLFIDFFFFLSLLISSWSISRFSFPLIILNYTIVWLRHLLFSNFCSPFPCRYHCHWLWLLSRL